MKNKLKMILILFGGISGFIGMYSVSKIISILIVVIALLIACAIFFYEKKEEKEQRTKDLKQKLENLKSQFRGSYCPIPYHTPYYITQLEVVFTDIELNELHQIKALDMDKVKEVWEIWRIENLKQQNELNRD